MAKADDLDSETTAVGETRRAATLRLSLYLRQLERLERIGRARVSSKELAEPLGLSAAQIRKDLAYFGHFGQAGVGYEVAVLQSSLRGVLGVDRPWNAALIGVGNLGRALLGYRGFVDRGFRIRAIFDRDPALASKRFHGLEVRGLNDLKRLVPKLQLELAILAVPADAAQEVANRAIKAGVVGLLSFAPTAISAPASVAVVSVDLGLQLEQLAFRVSQQRANQRKQSAG
jgi:redox-sensing transcriptional repressor